MFQAMSFVALAWWFGVDFRQANWAAGVLLMALAVAAFACLGIAEAGIGIVVKRGNPLAFALSSFSVLVGGAFFPVSLLPTWLQWISALHPLSYATEGVRAALLSGASFEQLLPEASALLVFDALSIPVSLWVFAWAVRRARTDGSLAHV
jgi:ABC-2 type transport system permease protein